MAVSGAPLISTTAPGLTIALRNVGSRPLVGAAPGAHGEHTTGHSNLTIEQCVISGMNLDDVALGSGSVEVANSTLGDNGCRRPAAIRPARANRNDPTDQEQQRRRRGSEPRRTGQHQ
jgi:hypothetical protein